MLGRGEKGGRGNEGDEYQCTPRRARAGDGKNEASSRKVKKATLPNKSWDTKGVDGHVNGMRMVGTIKRELKNHI